MIFLEVALFVIILGAGIVAFNTLPPAPPEDWEEK